jgi:DNA polymerase-3 subunit gamma/tau
MTVPNLFGDDQVPATKPSAGAQTQSLYRKYRPQSFDSDELVGQEHIVRTLRNAIHQGRVAHAYLFCGPRGTGKTTTARLLAKAVNCLNPDVMRRPCNECASCIAIGTGATSDVIEIDAASNRGIDDIRDLRERVKYSPTQLQTKFYIIDEAHQITGAAANAFLKTLEEPPPHTKFVLATTDPEELLATIVSRCQRFDFRRIGIDSTVARLRGVALAEHLEITDEALQTIARHATGSLRDALGLLDQLAVYGDHAAPDAMDRTITVDSVLALLGVSRNDRVERLVQALADHDASIALGTVNDAVEAGEDPRQLNRQLVAYLRVLMHERAGGSPDADERAKTLAARFDLPTLGHLARIFSETDYKIRHSPYAQLPLEIALVEAIVGVPTAAVAPAAVESDRSRSANIAPSRPTDDEILSVPPSTALRDRLRGGGRGGHLQVVAPQTSSEPAPAPSAPAQAPSAPAAPTAAPSARSAGSNGDVTVEQIAELWPRIRGDVKAVNRRIEALLASVDPVAINGGQVTLAAAYDFHRKRLNEDEVRRVVEEAISRVTGRLLTIHCVMRGEEPPQAPIAFAPAAAPRPVPSSQPVEPPPTLDATNDEPPDLDDTTSTDRDQQRLQAAKNIFDAEEIRS